MNLMIREKGSATLVVICIAFVIICIAFFYVTQTPGGNDLLMKSIGAIAPDQSPPEKYIDPQAAYMGKKITLPDGTIGCKRDELVCPDGKVEKRVMPECMFPRCL